WEVDNINVTDRFRDYQKNILRKAEREGLNYENIYESLALSSIIVLSWPCPYPKIFTNQEWAEIIKSNPYTIKNSPLSKEVSTSLHEATCNSFIGEDVFMNGGKTKLSRDVACSFNDLYNGLLMSPSKMTEKITEEEHCYMFLYPVIKPFFLNPLREYKLVLNRATSGSRKRPDLSCVVDDVTILNSEIKPLKCTPLQQKKDTVKAQLRARKSINMQLQKKGGPAEAGIFLNMGEWMESFFMDLRYDGLYRSWMFLRTKLVVEKASTPLAESAISHVIALEERVGKLAEEYKYRDSQNNQKNRTDQTMPPTSFIRKFPNTPQVKLLLNL
ncbi:3924_t:CDS:2, partial [Dentiscutata erythropus]